MINSTIVFPSFLLFLIHCQTHVTQWQLIITRQESLDALLPVVNREFSLWSINTFEYSIKVRCYGQTCLFVILLRYTRIYNSMLLLVLLGQIILLLSRCRISWRPDLLIGKNHLSADSCKSNDVNGDIWRWQWFVRIIFIIGNYNLQFLI